MKLTKTIKDDHVLYTNEEGYTWHLDLDDPLVDNLPEIEKLINNKKLKSGNPATSGLITYERCVDLGFCDGGIKLFARLAKLPDDNLEDLVLTQKEFDQLVTKYQRLILKEELLPEVVELVGDGVVWDTDYIAQDAQHSYLYALCVIKGRFPAGEEVIARSAYYSYLYILDVIQGRWPAGEEVIARDAYYSYLYARHVIEGRFPAGEGVISRDAHYSYSYALYVIEDRFPAGEEAIARDTQYNKLYNKLLDGIKENN